MQTRLGPMARVAVRQGLMQSMSRHQARAIMRDQDKMEELHYAIAQQAVADGMSLEESPALMQARGDGTRIRNIIDWISSHWSWIQSIVELLFGFKLPTIPPIDPPLNPPADPILDAPVALRTTDGPQAQCQTVEAALQPQAGDRVGFALPPIPPWLLTAIYSQIEPLAAKAIKALLPDLTRWLDEAKNIIKTEIASIVARLETGDIKVPGALTPLSTSTVGLGRRNRNRRKKKRAAPKKSAAKKSAGKDKVKLS